jgi:C-terminal processing protease CtpA/Prc
VSQSEGGKGITRVTVTFLENPETGTTRETTLVISSGGREKEIAIRQLAIDIVLPNQNPEYPANQYIFENIIEEWYYWDAEVAQTPADYNQPYRSFFDRYLMGLNQNELDGNVWAAETEQYLYSYITRTPVGEIGLAPLNYGMEFDLQEYKVENVNAHIVARVLYVMDGSPAKTAGLKRGDWFFKINDVPMADWKEDKTGEMQYKRLIDTLVRPVQGESPKLGMLTFQEYSGKVFDASRSTTVSSARFHGNPILYSQIFPAQMREGGNARVGYLVYNSFDPKFENELVEAFKRFKEYDNPNDGVEGPGITHLVLDLRYNKTGTVEMAKLMAELIVPESMNGQTFARYEFNGKHTDLNGEVKLSVNTNSVGLTTIYILTSAFTSGAAELLINSFRGLDEMDIVMIGDVTEGMNVGMIVRTYDTEEYRYEIHLAAFRCYNAAGQGDYRWGLSPNGGLLKEWDDKKWRQNGLWGWSGAQGATEDPLLRKAVEYIVGNSVMSGERVIDGSKKSRNGYVRIFSVPTNMTMDVPGI